MMYQTAKASSAMVASQATSPRISRGGGHHINTDIQSADTQGCSVLYFLKGVAASDDGDELAVLAKTLESLCAERTFTDLQGWHSSFLSNRMDMFHMTQARHKSNKTTREEAATSIPHAEMLA